MIIIGLLSAVAASLLLTNVSRYQTTFQSASWEEAIVAAEAGVDLAMNELRKRVVGSPSSSFGTGWTVTNPATGKAYSSFGHAFPDSGLPYSLPTHDGEGNTDSQVRVYVDVPGSDVAPDNFAAANDNSFISQLDNPKLRDPDGVDRSRWWYRVRALGIAGVPGPARPNMDRRDNRLRRISFFTDWRTGQSIDAPQAARLVEVVARPQTNFRNALMADKTINLSDQDVLVDSYDSSKGIYSATNQGTMGNVATNGKLINAGHATVKGDAMTNNGQVQDGDKVSGQQSANFYQELTSLKTEMLNPGWAGVASGGTLTADASYTASSDSTNPTLIRLDGINLSDSATVSINAPTVVTTGKGGKTTVATSTQPSYVKLYVQGDIATRGTGQIMVAENVNAIVYFTGNVDLEGSGVFNNSLVGRNLVLNGVQPPANADGSFPARSIKVSTTQDFAGIIYAPDHDLSLALQAVPVASTTSDGKTISTVTVGPIGPAQNKQIDDLNKKINKANDDYNKAMDDYNKEVNKNGANSPGALDKLKKAAEQQTKINQYKLQLAVLTGQGPASQAEDHAKGYNGIYGGFIAKSILVANKTHVHYDETLRTAGPVNHYEVVNWFEDHASREGTGGAGQFWWRGTVK